MCLKSYIQPLISERLSSSEAIITAPQESCTSSPLPPEIIRFLKYAFNFSSISSSSFHFQLVLSVSLKEGIHLGQVVVSLQKTQICIFLECGRTPGHPEITRTDPLISYFIQHSRISYSTLF